jgi:5-methylthioadenosine/S-adenosylhomocysteine deaminase
VCHTDAIAEVLEQSGIRAIFGKALMDRGQGVPPGLRESAAAAVDSALALARRWQGAGGGRLRVSLAPRFILTCSDALWRDVAAAAAEHGLLVHTHLAESPTEAREVEAVVASSAARYFAKCGVLSEHFVGAHGVWVDDEELSLLEHADAALVHCPGSNLKLGSGFANVRRWARAGLRRGLGSDGAACDNRLDTFHELSLAALISRTLDPGDHLTAREVLALATCEGARALGLGDVTGSLEPGKQADVIVVDHTAPHLAPNETLDPYTTLVHAARATDVRLTMVAGRILYRSGTWTTLEPERVAAEARTEARGLVRRADIGRAQG